MRSPLGIRDIGIIPDVETLLPITPLDVRDIGIVPQEFNFNVFEKVGDIIHQQAGYFGIDFPEETSLIANKYSVDEIRDILNLDSLGYMSVDGMLSCISAHPPENYCTACFTGDYPVAPPVKESNRRGRQI